MVNVNFVSNSTKKELFFDHKLTKQLNHVVMKQFYLIGLIVLLLSSRLSSLWAQEAISLRDCYEAPFISTLLKNRLPNSKAFWSCKRRLITVITYLSST